MPPVGVTKLRLTLSTAWRLPCPSKSTTLSRILEVEGLAVYIEKNEGMEVPLEGWWSSL